VTKAAQIGRFLFFCASAAPRAGARDCGPGVRGGAVLALLFGIFLRSLPVAGWERGMARDRALPVGRGSRGRILPGRRREFTAL